MINCFKDDFGENSFKRCIDIKEIAPRLQQQGLALDQQMAENMASLLICFGDIENEEGYGERVPPETEDQRKAKMLLEMKRNERAKNADPKEKKMVKQLTMEETEKKNKEDADWADLEERLIAQMKPSKPEKILLELTSIHDLLNALDRMQTFDRMLSEMEMTEFVSFEEEDRAL